MEKIKRALIVANELTMEDKEALYKLSSLTSIDVLYAVYILPHIPAYYYQIPSIGLIKKSHEADCEKKLWEMACVAKGNGNENTLLLLEGFVATLQFAMAHQIQVILVNNPKSFKRHCMWFSPSNNILIMKPGEFIQTDLSQVNFSNEIKNTFCFL